MNGWIAPNSFPGWYVLHKVETGSTNDDSAELLDEGYEKVIVTAEVQHHGRGRKGNFWHSPKGGCWISIGFNCNLPVMELSTPLVETLAIKFSNNFKTKFNVKQPNDIFLNGKKVLGLLIDTIIVDQTIKRLILGVGVNVNNPLPEPIMDIATSLKNEGIQTTPAEVAMLICNSALPFFKQLTG